MKRFEFSMQKILELKGHLQNEEKNILARMQQYQRKLYSDLDDVKNKYQMAKVDYFEKSKKGMDIVEVRLYNLYFSKLHADISTINSNIQKNSDEIDKQLIKVLNITREKTSLEKLRDKHYEEYKAQERKEEEIFINEFVVNSIFEKSLTPETM